MTRYIFRRLALSAIKLFVFVSLMFFFIQLMMPGDFVDQFALSCNAECRERMRAQLGLDLPLWKRYLKWLSQIVRLDLGTSLTGEPVLEVFKLIIPPTMLVFVTGTILAFMIGLWLGTRTAWWKSAFASRLTTLGGLTLFTSFPPWLAWLVSYIFTGGRRFYVVRGNFGGISSTFTGLDRFLWEAFPLSPSTVAFHMMLSLLAFFAIFYTIKGLLERVTRKSLPGIIFIILTGGGAVASWYLFDFAPQAFDLFDLAWLPLLIYVLLTFGETMIIMQSSMNDVLDSEYIQTARAKGLPTATIREKHAARNALLPVLSRLVISLPYLITGVVIIESSVGWPGMGTTMWNALYWQNIPIVMDILLLVGALSLVARLVLDVLSAYLDPRIRFGNEEKIQLA